MPPQRTTRRRADTTAGAGPVADPTPAAPAADIAPAPRRGRRLPAVHGGTRVTVDMPTDTHRALKRTAENLSDQIGVHVPIGQVMAALAHLVTVDAELRESVTTHLRERVEQ